MKKLWAILLAAAVFFALAACGKAPAPEAETTLEITEAAAVTGLTFPFPELPSGTAPGQTLPVIAGTGASIVTTTLAGSASVPAVSNSSTTTTTTKPGASSSSTTTTTTTTSTKINTSSTTTSTKATTSSATTTTTTTTTTTQAPPRVTKAPQTFNIDLAKIKALGLPNVTKTITTKNDYGTVKSYNVTGPTLKSVLAALGADMSAINGYTKLAVECTDPADPAKAEYNNFLINSGDSIMALTINGSEDDAPRLFPAVETGQQYAFSGRAIKCVDVMVLNYN